MLTKKDFKAVAEIIRDLTLMSYGNADTIDGMEIARVQITEEMADYFATQNPRFDRSRFMKACGLT